MRRLASVLVPSSRRTDKDAHPPNDDVGRPHLAHKKSRAFPSLSRKHLSSVDPSSLPPLVAGDLANSSSSSSSASTTLRTPDDDDGLPRTSSKKGSWKSWLGGKNVPVGDHLEAHHSPPWKSSKNALRPPKFGANETDDASSQSDDPYVNPDDILTPQQMAAARANARTLITNSLLHEPSTPPLLRSSDAISFPRSCHAPHTLRRRDTLESEMHKKSLLARLDRLSVCAESSIASLSSRSILPKPQIHRDFDSDIFPSTDSVNLHSSGLESWVSRPCFEDRLQLFTCSAFGELMRTRIPGSYLGVAALEFSESVELLAGTLLESSEDVEEDVTFDPALEFTLPLAALNPDPLATQMKESKLEPRFPPSDLSQSKDSLIPRSPSPQLGSVPVAPPKAPVMQQLDGLKASRSTVTNVPIPKRGVRFADDDGKDDQIPLGYVLRIRKNKEQKARFLREERERRERTAQLPVENRQAAPLPRENRVSRTAIPRQLPSRPLISLHEPSRPQQPVTISRVLREEERLRREAEKVEMEKLRRSRELARRQAEERERSYAEELQATRARREASRAGRPLETALLSTRITDRDHSASRDSMHVSLRGSNIPHKYTPELVFSPVSPHDGSPSSSVPATPGSQYSFSRPPSLYSAHTTSSEDVRGREGKHASRRMSVVSDSGKATLLHPPGVSFNPYTWTSVPTIPVIPPVPPLPVVPTVNGVPLYGLDMPLLPPTAPFMMNQFGARPRSYTGSTGQLSPFQSSTPLSRNYSSEGIDPGSRNSSLHSSRSHQRRSSDDVIRMAKTLADPRAGGYNDGRVGSKTSGSMHATPLQSNPQRSSWLPAEQSPTKRSSSLRPVSTAYPSGAHAQTRRRPAVS